MMAGLMKIYKNGNYFVEIYSDGTKIRTCLEDTFKPEFPECIDVTITKKCNGNCPYCYMGCTDKGKHCDTFDFMWLVKQVEPYTELALNVNDLTYPCLQGFLADLAAKKIITNITINQQHFMRNIGLLKYWESRGYFKGLGISYTHPEEGFIENVKKFENPVIHTIVGILTAEDLQYLSNKGLKLLLLGYKTKNRGQKYYDQLRAVIEGRTDIIRQNLKKICESFEVVSFDNLAIEQVRLKDNLTEEEWKTFYMGDEGQFTFYIDLVDKTFAINSMSKVEFPLMDNINEMFQFIRTKYEVR